MFWSFSYFSLAFIIARDEYFNNWSFDSSQNVTSPMNFTHEKFLFIVTFNFISCLDMNQSELRALLNIQN